MRTLAALTVAAVLAALPACNSGYIPQARGRVAMIMQGGGQVYVRDGQVYRHGFLGSGLRRAVAGNPAAERAAREDHDRQKDGLLLSTACLNSLVVAAARLGAAWKARRIKRQITPICMNHAPAAAAPRNTQAWNTASQR